MLKVGRISFANCTPLFMALEEGPGRVPVELVHGVPTDLNRGLLEGWLDLSPSSSVAYLRNPDELGFLPDLSISSIGPVESVLLFSRLPLHKLNGAPLCLTPSSATSVVMLRVLLETFAGVVPLYGSSPEGCEASLLIGDAALKAVEAKEYEYVYDLGALWHEATDTPFVFALWLVRRECFAEKPEQVRAFYRLLVAARQRAYRRYPEYSKVAPEASWLGCERLLSYWGTLSYDLTSWHLAGLNRFAKEAAGLGELSRVPDLAPVRVENLDTMPKCL